MCDSHVTRIRVAAGWALQPTGWLSHDGTPEQQWRDEGNPCPEDANYGDWYRAAYFWDALDNDIDPDAINPYPCAATE